MVIVSEADWLERSRSFDEGERWKPRAKYDNLGHLLADFAENVGFRDDDFRRPGADVRPLGSDIE